MTFSDSAGYLERRGAYELDPALPLVDGQQQTPAGQAMFGGLHLSRPRPLRVAGSSRERRERRAGAADETERSLGEIDYLWGGRDEDMRQGALRFRDPETGAFLTADTPASRCWSVCRGCWRLPNGTKEAKPTMTI